MHLKNADYLLKLSGSSNYLNLWTCGFCHYDVDRHSWTTEYEIKVAVTSTSR